MKIHPLEESMLERLESLIENYRFLPYKEYKINQSRLIDNVIEDISGIVSNKESTVLVAERAGKIKGLVSCEKLNWDTKHFGIEMARIKYLMAEGGYSTAFETKSNLLSYLSMKYSYRQIAHLSVRVDTEDTSSFHALENRGFRLMDTTVSYSFDYRKNPIIELENECYVRESQQNEVDELAEIAIESFQKQRTATDKFHADPFLPPEKSDDLYVKWIVNSCRGLADTVLVAEVGGALVGFTTCKVYRQLSQKLDVRLGAMILSAVSPSARGRGVHTSLINAGLRWLSNKVDFVEAGTQLSNYAVQRSWSRLGFRLIRSQYTLHRSIKGES